MNVILGVLENIFEICPFKRTNLNSVGLGGLNVDREYKRGGDVHDFVF